MALGPDDEIEIHVRYTRDDFVAAIRTHIALRSKLLRWFIAIPIGLVFVALGVVGGLRGGWTWAPLLSILTGVFFFVSLVSIYFLQPRRFFRDNQNLFDAEWVYRFSRDVIFLERQEISSTLTWQAVTKVVESPVGYLLLMSNDQFLVIPRRAFRSADDERAFRVMLPRVA
ncbi:MAG: YcxB family protein [Deltaproteobacteria bacterium]|nr:YcxB family protein [Deltaproteobacteria bacterium]